ncbi:hypothetical protein [Salinibaculum salinum]|uniref:hypothetical protein n=1 Tax=Salinibaculum salinum TaxID=3131996 RepID=UPI0030EC55E7
MTDWGRLARELVKSGVSGVYGGTIVFSSSNGSTAETAIFTLIAFPIVLMAFAVAEKLYGKPKRPEKGKKEEDKTKEESQGNSIYYAS